MKLIKLTVRNFRCIENDAIELTPYTVLVGRNGTGKSTFLEAMQFFYSPGYSLKKEDFSDHDDTRELVVAASFGDLDEAERTEFQRYVIGNTLVVERVGRRDETGSRYIVTYHGNRMQNEDFLHVRALTGREHLAAYRALREGPRYGDLPAVRSEAEARAALDTWDEGHPDRCTPQRDDGRFFGFQNVGIGKLDKYTSFVRVPALMNSRAQTQEGSTNTLKALVDILVRDRGGARTLIEQLRTRVEQEYRDVLEQPAFSLSPVSDALTQGIAEFAPGVEVKVNWTSSAGIKFVEPTAVVDLSEGGLTTPPEYKGHGLLRAYELSVLGLLSEQARALGTTEQVRRGVVIAIDEPELYQHPAQIRIIAARLQKLAGSRIGDSAVQVVCTSHSPLFVTLEQCESIRAVRRGEVGRVAGRCTIRQARFIDMAPKLEAAYQGVDRYTAEGLKARMAHLFNPSITEAVVADFAVLVEGDEDVAWLEGCFGYANQLEPMRRLGVFVVPVKGKNDLDRLVLLLNELGVPSYVVFDSDYDKTDELESNQRTNAAIASLCSGTLVREVPAATCVHRDYAVMNPNLTRQMHNEFGPQCLTVRDTVAGEFGYAQPSRATKNPRVIREVFTRLAAAGRQSLTALEILAAIKAKARIPDTGLYVAADNAAPLDTTAAGGGPAEAVPEEPRPGAVMPE